MKINDLYNNNINTNNGYVSDISQKTASDSQKTNTNPQNTAKTDTVETSVETKAVNGKLNDSERSALIQSLKADMDNQMLRFTNMMTQMFQKQGITGITAQGDDMWRRIASGNFTVDAQTKADAQQAISEDGYWGVKQTSQRIFDFAYAIAGDDAVMMKKMQAAVEKGFKQATASWGKELPSISNETHSAVNDLFDEYYKKAGIEEI